MKDRDQSNERGIPMPTAQTRPVATPSRRRAQGHQHTMSTRFPGVLFENIEERSAALTAREPECFHDLSLHRLVESVIVGREEYDLKPFFFAPPKDFSTISYRHEVWLDLENNELLSCIEAFAERMREARRRMTKSSKSYYPREKQRWHLDSAQTYIEAVNLLLTDLRRIGPASRAFHMFLEKLADYAGSSRFQELAAQERGVRSALAGVHYQLRLSGDSVTVSPFESVDDYTTAIEATFAKFRQGETKDYRVKFPELGSMNHVDAAILDMVVRLHPEPFRLLENFCNRWSAFFDEDVVAFERDSQFYTALFGYVQELRRDGLPFCLPKMSAKSKETNCRDAFDIALADAQRKRKEKDKAIPVLNDIALRGKERVLVITGPNQGGKTTYARLFGQIHYLAALGLLVPAREASLFRCDHVFTHFERQEDATSERGKLQEELTRLHRILSEASPDSVIVLNEMFSSTSVEDARKLSRQILERIFSLDALCACTTFLDELSVLNEKTVSIVAEVDKNDLTRRTFRLERRPADGLAYAMALAEKHQLTYTLLRRRIKS